MSKWGKVADELVTSLPISLIFSPGRVTSLMVLAKIWQLTQCALLTAPTSRIPDPYVILRIPGYDGGFMCCGRIYKRCAAGSITFLAMSNNLYLHPLFKKRMEHLSRDAQVLLSYQRARLVVQTYSKSLSTP